jgi:hypothetical protein
MLDERMECLGERSSAASATIEIFTKADAEVVDKAVSSIDSLPNVGDCANATRLRAAKLRRPSDPATLARIAEVEPKLAQVRALYEAGGAFAAEEVRSVHRAT